MYDWGSQFGGSNATVKPTGNNEAVVEQREQENFQEQAPEEPAPAEKNDTASPPTETVVTSPEDPKPQERAFDREEWEKMVTQQRECKEMADCSLERFQQLLSLCAEPQLPKWTNGIISHLGYLSDVSGATMALVEYYLETNEEQKIHTIEESKLKSYAFHTFTMVQSYKTDLKEALDLFEERVNNGEERHLLNLCTRVIKKITDKFSDLTKPQAKAYSKALDAYSPAQGALALLKQFANQGNRDVMDSIDNTLNLAETDMVLTEDAPAMLEALEHNDTETIIRLQQKLIDHLFEKK